MLMMDSDDKPDAKLNPDILSTSNDLSCQPPPSPIGTINIDPDGDIYLLVGDDKKSKRFHVSSHAMRLASPVWSAMLSPKYGFKESVSGTEDIAFAEDNLEAFFIVLLASHLKFQAIPVHTSTELLVAICGICDKYDCVSVLGPWMSAWVDAWLPHGDPVDFGRQVFVAWVVGDTTSFKNIIEGLVDTCYTNSIGNCLSCISKNLDRDLLPGLPGECYGAISLSHNFLNLSTIIYPLTPCSIDKILQARLDTLTELIKICHKYIGSSEAMTCKEKNDKDACHALSVGALVVSLRKLVILRGRPPVVASRLTETTPVRLLTQINGIPNYVYREPGDPGYTHSKCGLVVPLRAEALNVLKNKASLLHDSYQIHLEAQRQKLQPSKELFPEIQLM